MMSLFNTLITFFSIIFFSATVVKAKNIAHVTPPTIHKTQELNIQSLVLKLVKLSNLVGSVD